MFWMMGKTAFPRWGGQRTAENLRVRTKRGFGTIHQTVGVTSKRRLFVKLGRLGSNIRDLEAAAYDVVPMVEKAGSRAAGKPSR